MIHYGSYLCLEKKEDYTKDSIGGGIIDYDIKELTFPCFFKRSDSYDMHFCGTWVRGNFADEMANEVRETINLLIDIETAIHTNELKTEKVR